MILCLVMFPAFSGCGNDTEGVFTGTGESLNNNRENLSGSGGTDAGNPPPSPDLPFLPESSDELSGTGAPYERQSGAFPLKFTASDIYGNTVTEDDLGEKQLFFVHYWATWCGPCVREMPDLAETVSVYGDRVGFIALLDDYNSNMSGAVRMVEEAGVPSEFIMVDAGTPDLRDLLAALQTGYVPTTVILEPSGGIYDPPIIGALGPRYAELLDLLLYYEDNSGEKK